jgi:hypothetical protein
MPRLSTNSKRQSATPDEIHDLIRVPWGTQTRSEFPNLSFLGLVLYRPSVVLTLDPQERSTLNRQ